MIANQFYACGTVFLRVFLFVTVHMCTLPSVSMRFLFLVGRICWQPDRKQEECAIVVFVAVVKYLAATQKQT